MLVVVSYDVQDDRRRAAICNALKDCGDHVQYSVFECRLSGKQLAELQAQLAGLASPRTDSIRYYRLCERCADRVVVKGRDKSLTTSG
jgi:CRISPR-associated protein Cas2